MKTSDRKGLENILQALENFVQPMLEKLKYDKTYRGKIIEHKGSGLYTVQINGKEYDIQTNTTNLVINSVVKVKAPLNNFSDIYIEATGNGGGSGTTDYVALSNKPQINSVELLGNRTLHELGIQPEGSYVVDANYVHTDNNYTTTDKNKLAGIQTGAQVNVIETVQKNGVALPVTSKTVNVTVPTKTSDLTNDSNYVVDASYNHTDNNYTTTDKSKLAGIQAGAEVNVQADWNETNTSADDYIKNKPDTVSMTSQINSLLNERQITYESTGFTNNSNITVSYDSVARTVTLTGTFEAYYKGEKITVLTNGWVSSAHADVYGSYFLRYDDSGFHFDTTPWNFNTLQIAYVQYFSGSKIALREVHGFMPWQSHKEFHETNGTYKSSGGTLSAGSYVINSTTATNRRPDIDATLVTDEDLQSSINSLTTKLYTHRYLVGSGATRTLTTGNAEIIPVNGNIPYYNQLVGGSWTQTLMTNNDYAAIFVAAIPTTNDSNSQNYRYMFVQPQQVGNLPTIQTLTPASLNLGDSSALVSEFVFISKIIIAVNGNNWTIQQVDILSGSQHFQTSSASGNFLSIVNHDATLSGSGVASDPLNISSANAGTVINNANVKTTPIDTDMFGLMDSANNNILTKLSWANLKSAVIAPTIPDWINIGQAATYSNVRGSRSIINFIGDLTTTLAKGNRFKCTQSQALTAYWNFDSDSNSQVTSITGNEFNISHVSGLFGNCISLNGTTSRVEIADTSVLKPTGSFTFGVRIKVSTTGVIFQSYSQNTAYAGIRFDVASGGVVRMISGKNTGTVSGTDFVVLSGTTSVLDGNWHSAIFSVVDNYGKLFIDGKLDASGYWMTPVYAATNYIRWGCQNSSGINSSFITGLIDDSFFINGYGMDDVNAAIISSSNSALGTSALNIISYGIIQSVGAYSGGITPVTINMGMDNSLINATISNVYYSMKLNPSLFPSKFSDNEIFSKLFTAPIASFNFTSLDINSDGGIYEIQMFIPTTDSANDNPILQINGLTSGYYITRSYIVNSGTDTTGSTITIPSTSFGGDYNLNSIGINMGTHRPGCSMLTRAQVTLFGNEMNYNYQSESMGVGYQAVHNSAGSRSNVGNITSMLLKYNSGSNNIQPGTVIKIFKK